VPLKGVFKIDLKRDALTGAFRVLEVNARFNLWHHIGARNGVNLPRVAYDYLVHGTRPAASPRYGTAIRWICVPLDVKAYRELSSRGRLSAARWLGSLASRKVYDLFSWTDPAPALRELRNRLASRLQRWHMRFKSQPQ
jgi:predicted ATP-grasp superfamily ATP-dependent carboligase